MNTTSVELSRRIDGAGIKGPSEFVWVVPEHHATPMMIRTTDVSFDEYTGKYFYWIAGVDVKQPCKLIAPAYTASECWAMLPKVVEGHLLTVIKSRDYTVAYYCNPSELEDMCYADATFDSPHLVEALGRLLLWCAANGHLEVQG